MFSTSDLVSKYGVPRTRSLQTDVHRRSRGKLSLPLVREMHKTCKLCPGHLLHGPTHAGRSPEYEDNMWVKLSLMHIITNDIGFDKAIGEAEMTKFAAKCRRN